MEIDDYIRKKTQLQNLILEFLDNNKYDNTQMSNLIAEIQQFEDNKIEFKEFLSLIMSISKYHYRNDTFIQKIEDILIYFESKIKQYYTNNEIFKIFKRNRRILLFIFKKGILKIDEFIARQLTYKFQSNIYLYFYPEIKQFLLESEKKEIDDKFLQYGPDVFTNFEEKRLIGENEAYYCELIRKDSIREFSNHFIHSQLSVNHKIKPSIFETNSFLINAEPTLIEYAAFHGSIKIFNYLAEHNAELKETLLEYAIFSRNIRLIHQVEEIEEVQRFYSKEVDSIRTLIDYSIKSHQQNLFYYFINNYMDESTSKSINLRFAPRYHNYALFPKEISTNSNFFISLCKYYHYNIIKILVESQGFNFNVDDNEEKKYDRFLPFVAALFSNNDDVFDLLYNLPGGDYLNIKSLKKYQLARMLIPPSITELDASTFEKWEFLMIASIPSITNIKVSTFSGCKRLTYVNLSPSLISIGSWAFQKCSLLKNVTIPSSVESIGMGAFNQCFCLEKVTFLSDKIKTLSYCIFKYCKRLSDINIPSSVTVIKESAFEECISLSNLTLPPSLVSIDTMAFKSCEALKKLTIPSSVTEIGKDAFVQSGLEHITISPNFDLDLIGIPFLAYIHNP